MGMTSCCNPSLYLSAVGRRCSYKRPAQVPLLGGDFAPWVIWDLRFFHLWLCHLLGTQMLGLQPEDG